MNLNRQAWNQKFSPIAKHLFARVFLSGEFWAATVSNVVLWIFFSQILNKETIQVQFRENGLLLNEKAVANLQLNLQVDGKVYNGVVVGNLIDFKDVPLNKFVSHDIFFFLGKDSKFSLTATASPKSESSTYILSVSRKKADMRIFALLDDKILPPTKLGTLELTANVSDGNDSQFILNELRGNYLYFAGVPKIDADGNEQKIVFSLNSDSYAISNRKVWNSSDSIVNIKLVEKGHQPISKIDYSSAKVHEAEQRAMTFYVVDNQNKPLPNINIRTTELGSFITDHRGMAKVPFEKSESFKSVGFMFLDPTNQHTLFSDSYRLIDTPDIIVSLTSTSLQSK